jgi:uncharacterized protein (TIGR00255 family)
MVWLRLICPITLIKRYSVPFVHIAHKIGLMIFSMTGYGRTEFSVRDKIFVIELRSLNGKQYDLRLNIPSILRPQEMEIRNLLTENLGRGSVECTIFLKQNGSERPVTINTQLLKAYFDQLTEFAREEKISTENILSTLLKLPEVITASADTLKDDEWPNVLEQLHHAIYLLNEHRRREGSALQKDLLERIGAIEALENEVARLAPQRRIKLKEELEALLQQYVGKDVYDPNRLEQELIYYIEKIDISEEQVRLKAHCDYFRQVVNDSNHEKSKGKKLSFILQEIGREINTTGSKAYDAAIQKCVVLMKDELEKAKEQILNIL